MTIDTLRIITTSNLHTLRIDVSRGLPGADGGGEGSGDVVGPASAVDSNLASFDTTTGKLLKDSGNAVSDFATAAQGTLADSATQPGDLSVYQLQPAEGAFEDGDKSKLEETETSGQLDSRDSENRDRSNHTGSQNLSTISDAGTVASLDVPAVGDAAVGEVVKGSDTRLSDARTPASHTLASHSDVATTGAELDADHTKLAGIESGATADQTDAEILTAVESESGRDMSVDGTKLDAITGTNTGDEAAASTTVAGVAEIATTAEINTGTDATRTISPDTLEGSNYNWEGPAGIALTAEDGDLTASTSVPLATFHLQRDTLFENFPFGVTTAPTGSTVTFDIHLNGTTIFSTKPTIDAGEDHTSTAATTAVLSTTSGSVGDKVEIFCDSAGATIAGAGAKSYCNGKHATS